MQVEGMRGPDFALVVDREGELDRRIRRARVHAAAREEVRRARRPAQDLEEDGGAGRGERRPVHEELAPVERHQQTQRVVDPAVHRLARRRGVVERHKGGLDERRGAVRLRRGRLREGRTEVAEDRRVHAPCEVGRAAVGERADPVVIDGLGGGEDERVALPGEDLDGIDGERLVVDRVDLDDGHVVAVDGEGEVRVAGHGYEAEAVALALGNGDDGEVGCVAAGVAADAVDEDSVGTKAERSLAGGSKKS